MITGKKALKIYQFIETVGVAPEAVIMALSNNSMRTMASLQYERIVQKYTYGKINYYYLKNTMPNTHFLHSETIKAWFTLRWLEYGCTVEDGIYVSKAGQRFELSIDSVNNNAIIRSNEYQYFANLDNLIKYKSLSESLKD